MDQRKASHEFSHASIFRQAEDYACMIAALGVKAEKIIVLRDEHSSSVCRERQLSAVDGAHHAGVARCRGIDIAKA